MKDTLTNEKKNVGGENDGNFKADCWVSLAQRKENCMARLKINEQIKLLQCNHTIQCLTSGIKIYAAANFTLEVEYSKLRLAPAFVAPLIKSGLG